MYNQDECEKINEKLFSSVIAVTNRTLAERPFEEQIERVCKVHPKAIILREKDLSEEEYLQIGKCIKKFFSAKN